MSPIKVSTPLLSSLLVTGLSFSLVIGLSGCASESATSSKPTSSTTKTAQVAPTKGEAKGASTALPTPTGTLTPKLEFSCANLDKTLSLKGYSLNTTFAPDPSSAEGRALTSGGSSCQWQIPEGSEWVTASVEKVSPEDYRDFAESLRGFYSPASFGTTNDSLEFFSTDGANSTAKILNTSYLVTLNSNAVLNQKDLGALAHKQNCC